MALEKEAPATAVVVLDDLAVGGAAGSLSVEVRTAQKTTG